MSADSGASMNEELQHLKRVSRIKHTILRNYLPPWTVILGSGNTELAYFDCFAGPGRYEMEGQVVPGSPVIAAQSAIEFLEKRRNHSLTMFLVDDDPKHLEQLETSLKQLQPYPSNLQVLPRRADSNLYIPNLLKSVRVGVPSFFLVDPYGHPLPIPVINQILGRARTEVLINLMWFRINMNLGNRSMEGHLDNLFGSRTWREQPFLKMRGKAREDAFVNFFCSSLTASHMLRFKIRYDVEDRTGGARTKYYLLHASNRVEAALLMKDVMWPLGDEEGTFDYSGESQGILISQTPTEQELKEILLREFRGKELEFDEIRRITWSLPFIEEHYRPVIKNMEGKETNITRITSRRDGLKGRDRVRFL
jgi:three-Cys-motif partner protein